MLNNYIIQYIKQGNKLSHSIYSSKGLWQDCRLSPLLFNIYLERMLRKWQSSGDMGIPIDEFPFLSLHLEFCE